MAYSRDFDGVRVQEDDGTTLRVDATSIDNETGQPGTKDPATAFHVVLLTPKGDVCRVSDRVDRGVDGSWSAFLPSAAPAFEGHHEVDVIGIASNADGPPDVWQERHRILTRSGSPVTS
jgi:hypothetical protein